MLRACVYSVALLCLTADAPFAQEESARGDLTAHIRRATGWPIPSVQAAAPNTKCTNCHGGTALWVNPRFDPSMADLSGNLVHVPKPKKAPQAPVSLSVADETTRILLGIEKPAVVVEGICPLQPDETLGLQVHDVILEVNGQPAKEPGIVHQTLVSPEAVRLLVLRKGDEKKLTRDAKQTEGSRRYLIGVTLGELAPVVRSQLELDESVSVFVREVRDESAASKAGLKPHDILLKVNDKPVTNNEAVQKAVAESKGQPLTLTIIRGAKKRTVEVTPQLLDVPTPISAATSDLGSYVTNATILGVNGVHWNQAMDDYIFGTKQIPRGNKPILDRLAELEKKLDEIAAAVQSLKPPQE